MKKYLSGVLVASADRCEFFYKCGLGSFNAKGDFVFDGPVGWIGYRQDNAGHPAFA